MTIGPAPMMRMVFRSSRFGICDSRRGGEGGARPGPGAVHFANCSRPGALASARALKFSVVDQLHEPFEQIIGVVGARACFRVVLHREGSLFRDTEAFYGLVVQIDVGEL